jgi:hypothetical protein
MFYGKFDAKSVRCVSKSPVVPSQLKNKLGSAMRIALSSNRVQLYVVSHLVMDAHAGQLSIGDADLLLEVVR